MKTKKVANLTLFFLLTCINIAFSYWEEKVMPGEISETFIPLAIGNAKNDGKNRIYGTEYQMVNSSRTVLIEYSWNGSVWDKTVIFSTFTRFGITPLPESNRAGVAELLLTSIVIGDTYSDGKNKIYIGYSYFADNYDPHNDPDFYIDRLLQHPVGVKIFEFTWTGSSWTAYQINTDSVSFNGASWSGQSYQFKNPVILRLADARNDGKNRLYIGTGGSEVWEYSWSGSSFTKILVTGPMTPFLLPSGYMTSYEIDSLVIADGRNDGINRLYAQSGGYSPYSTNFKAQSMIPGPYGSHKLAEYTWNASLNKWDETIISSSLDSETYYGGLFIDDARNDGIKRIYSFGIEYEIKQIRILPDDRTKIIEYTFNNKTLKWEQGRYQFKSKLGPRTIYADWGSISVGWPEDFPNFFIAALADARGDGIKRIYVDYGGAWKNQFMKLMNSDNNGVLKELTVPWGEYQELTWNGTGFDTERIPVRFIKTFLSGKARNDGITRAYSAAGIEYIYNKTYSTKASSEYLVPMNNYFNPLKNEKATIIYKPSADGNISVKIYTLHGKIVKTLISGMQYKGEYGITWDGTNDSGQVVASGIYLVHLEAPGISQTKKICVLK